MSKNKDSPKEELIVFAILFQQEMSVFVGHCKADRLQPTYKSHYYLQNQKTADLFRKYRSSGRPPPVYQLSQLHCTKKESFLHIIAWSYHFAKQGYHILSGTGITQYFEPLGPEVQAIYEDIKDTSLQEICSSEGGMFPSFGQRSPAQSTEARYRINIRFTKEEYEAIQEDARKHNLTPTAYCRRKIQTGAVSVLDREVLADFIDYVTAFRQRNTLLTGILQEMHQTKTYNIINLREVQKMVLANRAQQEAAFTRLEKIMTQLKTYKEVQHDH